eukprot:m51a1_g3612 hypothetical protein (381) ;mRNA; r:58209-60104
MGRRRVRFAQLLCLLTLLAALRVLLESSLWLGCALTLSNAVYPLALLAVRVVPAVARRPLGPACQAGPPPPEAGPLDVVISYVDGDDPAWRARYRQWAPDAKKDAKRSRNNNEICYSLRSVKLHVPWVRHVFVATDCAVPRCVARAVKTGWVSVVPLDDFVPAQYLPTFNSHTIELFLHRIPGIAETFLYLCDDMFVGRRISRADVFDSLGRVRLNPDPVTTMLEIPEFIPANQYLKMLRYTAAQLQSKLPNTRPFRPTHQGIVLTRRHHAGMHELFPVQVNNTASHKFRSPDQIVPGMASAVLSAAAGDACVQFDGDERFIQLRCDRCDHEKLRRLRSDARKPRWICINDDCEAEGQSHAFMRQALEEIFPLPVEWVQR